ncbi:hypothetical protein CRE_06047 [Caenorhabditis remanei]|uniref:Uncharacterized protein n=1 Tax=Caenorhabditis remanei TaxID=31234 RepID=E3N6J3_CAERE|nr:hypothetical protein CRE_06047 [Caenorhabditis remanei]
MEKPAPTRSNRKVQFADQQQGNSRKRKASGDMEADENTNGDNMEELAGPSRSGISGMTTARADRKKIAKEGSLPLSSCSSSEADNSCLGMITPAMGNHDAATSTTDVLPKNAFLISKLESGLELKTGKQKNHVTEVDGFKKNKIESRTDKRSDLQGSPEGSASTSKTSMKNFKETPETEKAEAPRTKNIFRRLSLPGPSSYQRDTIKFNKLYESVKSCLHIIVLQHKRGSVSVHEMLTFLYSIVIHIRSSFLSGLVNDIQETLKQYNAYGVSPKMSLESARSVIDILLLACSQL